MPFGMPGGVINAPGNPYNGQLVLTTLVNINRQAQSQDPTVRARAVSDFNTLAALPQFHGFGWRGLLNFGLAAAPGAIGALAGLGAGAGAAAGTTSSGQLTAGTVVPGTLPAIGGSTAGIGGSVGLTGLGSLLGNLGNNAGPWSERIPGQTSSGPFGLGTSGIGGTGINYGDLLRLGLGGLAGTINNTEGARTSTITPTITPEYQGLSDLLRQRAIDRLMQSADTSGIVANAISGINDAYKGITQSTANSLTNRGLASSPVAATSVTNTNLARAGDITGFLNNLPLLQQQLQTQDINTAGNVLSQFGRGSSAVGAGSAVGGGLTGIAAQLGYMYQKRNNPFGVT